MAKATKDSSEDKKTVQPVDFPEVSEGQVATTTSQFDILLDLDVEVTVALGNLDISVKELLQLGPGAVLTLNKSIEAPVDLYVQGTKFADGDVVVVDDCFAVRIKNIVGLENAPIDTQ
jgi:flagellar motor switch protein FliN